MRWLYADPTSPTEAAYVQETIAAIDRWWQAFQGHAGDIAKACQRRTSFDLPRFMEDHLQAIHPELMWDFGPALKQPGERLVITPESQRHLRPMLRTLFERAPKVGGWEFYPYRPAETAEVVIESVKARVGVQIEGALVEPSLGPGNKVNLHYAFPKSKKLTDELAQQAAFVATEALMGEQVLDTWIGEIGLVEENGREAGHALDLTRTQATVAALIRGRLDQLPGLPRKDLSLNDDWTSVELEPPEAADDYQGRSDLVVATIREVALFEAIHCGLPFTSACFSRVGETFCYLKLDGADLGGMNLVDYRTPVEEALQAALAAAGGGCVMGGGSGLRYAYIDMALTEMKRATPLIRHVLAEHKAPTRSWLLFNDDDLAAEWIGAFRETEAPPGT